MLAALSAAFMFKPVRAGISYDGSSRAARYAGNAGAGLDDAKLNRLEQTKEAIGNGVCFDKKAVAGEDVAVRETVRGYLNGKGQLPESPDEALKDGTCRTLGYGKSYLHDFNDKVAGICNASPENRALCYLLAVAEFYGGLPPGTVLNVEGNHNIKIVCDGGEEYVFDKDGRIVDSGINEGTFNLSPPENWVGHALNDIIAAVQQLPVKSSLSKEEAVRLLDDCIRRRREAVAKAESDTRDLFSGKKPAGETLARGGKSADTRNIAMGVSRLEELLKKKLAILEKIVSRGTKATEDEIDVNNALSKEFESELKRISEQIESLPLTDKEKSALFVREMEKLDALGKRLASLQEIAQARKLLTMGAFGQDTSAEQPDRSSCSCANPVPYMAVSDGAILLPNGLYPCRCRTCGRILGIASPNGKLTSPNKAANGMTVKEPGNPILKSR